MKTTYCVYNRTTQAFLALNVTGACTMPARLRGLIGKLGISPEEGLWVSPSRGIHTIGLLFPIDVIYLDANKRVVHLVEHMRPFRIGQIRLDCASVLEVPPHTIYTSRTRVGDQLLIVPPAEMETDLKLSVPSGAVPSGADRSGSTGNPQ